MKKNTTRVQTQPAGFSALEPVSVDLAKRVFQVAVDHSSGQVISEDRIESRARRNQKVSMENCPPPFH